MSWRKAYEVAVYVEETDLIVCEVSELLKRKTAEITDARVRNGMLAAVLATVAQDLDGTARAQDPAIVADGVTGGLVACIDRWRKQRP